VLKPDPRTSVSGGALLAEMFAAAGLPDGVLHVLPGDADAGEALITDPDVRVIAFTGSTRAGRAVAKLAGEHLKRVHLELGGNSALIVLDDVDVDKATSVGAFGSFIHQGQICMSTSRHLVHSSIAKEYASALAARAEHLPVGDPFADQVALGPLIDEGQRDNVHRIVTASVDAGAALLTGGTYEGLFYRPTVLGDVPTSAPAYAEEIFGPVAPVVGFDSIDEAVELATGTDYGLSLGILTRDVYKGLELAERIPTGLVHINDQTVADEATIPFGGVGASGNGGRLGGARANMEAFTETQWVTVRGDLPAYPF
jgi:benzaldehyde dehydrogenase (NAD)